MTWGDRPGQRDADLMVQLATRRYIATWACASRAPDTTPGDPRTFKSTTRMRSSLRAPCPFRWVPFNHRRVTPSAAGATIR